MKKKQQKDRAKLTVAELMKTSGVPLWVRFRLERVVGGGHALELHGLHDDSATHEIARLVYDVLDTDSHVQFADIDDHNPHPHFPAEARDFIEDGCTASRTTTECCSPEATPTWRLWP